MKVAAVRSVPTPRAEIAVQHALQCARVAQDNKARNIVVLDMRDITPLYDFFVLATGATGVGFWMRPAHAQAADPKTSPSHLALDTRPANPVAVGSEDRAKAAALERIKAELGQLGTWQSPTGDFRLWVGRVTADRLHEVVIKRPGLMMIRASGAQRFRITASDQLRHGLWVADVERLGADMVVPIPDDLKVTADALGH